jgi:hypothetical protein
MTEQAFREKFLSRWGSRISTALGARLAYTSGKIERVEGEGRAGWFIIKIADVEVRLVVHADAVNKTGLKAGDDVECLSDPIDTSVWCVEKIRKATEAEKVVDEAYG